MMTGKGMETKPESGFVETGKAHTIYLCTNRNCLVYDAQDNQILKYQRAMRRRDFDKMLAREAAATGEKFYLMRWREWCHEISRQEFKWLMGLGADDDGEGCGN